jgi:hypothetical protein
LRREKTFTALFEYYHVNRHANTSPLVRGCFVNISLEPGVGDKMYLDLTNSFLLVYILSLFPPSLLEDLRTSTELYSTYFRDEDDTVISTVDFYVLIVHVPLLVGIVKEVLRILSTDASVRVLAKLLLLMKSSRSRKILWSLYVLQTAIAIPTVGHDDAEFKPNEQGE